MENIKFQGNMYLTPWTIDGEWNKKYWWHRTPFAYGPIKSLNIKLKY